MKAFLGLIINMGPIPLPDMKYYWSSEWATQIPFLGDVMSRVRLLQIFWMIHVGNDTTNESNRAENLSSCIVLVSTDFAFSLYALVVPTF
jgi:hypothetical protein